MADEAPTGVAEAKVVTRRRLSAVWVIPIIAAAIGAWLTWKSVNEKGPAFTLTFSTADGLEAGKTKIKFRELEIGEVESLQLADDLTHVVAHARLAPGLGKYLTDKTRFWVVRARVTAGGVTGLGTLLSGAFIGIDPITRGKAVRAFEGLESAPLITSRVAGKRFVLKAPSQGSLDVGAPVHYKQINVGEVVRTQIDVTGEFVHVHVFVRAPYDEWVRTTTRWYSASGIRATVNQDGLQIETESFMSLMIGGLGFGTPPGERGEPAEPGASYPLYASQAAVGERIYDLKKSYMVQFDGNVKGLGEGASVEFRGIKIGRVVEVSLLYNPREKQMRIPVVIEIEPERIVVDSPDEIDMIAEFESLVAKGMRARLETGNLLTGQLLVALDIFPDAPPAEIITGGVYPELPTIPTRLDQLAANVGKLVEKVDKLVGEIPLAQIGDDVHGALVALRGTLDQARAMVANTEARLVPALEKTIQEAAQTMKTAQGTLGTAEGLVAPSSPLAVELLRVLGELNETVRSFRHLAERLERNPESLIRGRSGDE